MVLITLISLLLLTELGHCGTYSWIPNAKNTDGYRINFRHEDHSTTTHDCGLPVVNGEGRMECTVTEPADTVLVYATAYNEAGESTPSKRVLHKNNFSGFYISGD